MCGLFFSTRQHSNAELAEKMKLMQRRGPDHQFAEVYNGISMAHSRLAIVDLDDRSNQPFKYQGRFLVFNGEIYNHKEIRNELEALGYKFTTQSDTEVLLKSYIEFGSECLDKFNGMFAFVIYDSIKEEIFAARDRFGKKPLYYTFDREGFSASSLCTQLIGSVSNVEICSNATESFFKYKYIPAPNSIVNNIKKLPAGCFIKFSRGESCADVTPYYDFMAKVEVRTGSQVSLSKAKSELVELLGSAVSMRLEADVPVGVFLSGGLDSSLVAAIAQDHSNVPIRTFSVAFSDAKFDESEAARAVADHIGSDHTEILCEPTDMLSMLLEYTSCYDEPFADPSAIPSMLLCRAASDKVTVALTGDGADETFLGYNRYASIARYEGLYRIPRKVRNALAGLLPDTSPKLRTAAALLSLKDINELYHALLQPLDQQYFCGDIRKNSTSHHFQNKGGNDSIAAAGRFDTLTYLPDDINVKIDRASMHSSLELRCPFLDFRVVEYGAALPQKFRFAGGSQKRILKHIATDYLPRSILNKPKSGFSAPIGDWFKNELRDEVKEILTLERLQEIPSINAPIAAKLISDHLNGKASKPNEIFKLLVYVFWQDKWAMLGRGIDG